MLRFSKGLRGEGGFAFAPGDGSSGAPVGGRAILVATRSIDGLRSVLAADGWPVLNRTQLLLLAVLPPGGRTPTWLARRIGVSRQSLHRQANVLVGHELLVADPAFGTDRKTVLRLTSRGAELVAAARAVLLAWDDEFREFLQG
jgi:DNA-binding MarR family transcriptional regulator